MARTLPLALLIAVTFAVAGDAAPATKPDVITTELTKGRCKFIDDDGEVGHYALKRCPGPAGMQLYTEATMQTVTLFLQRDKSPITREVVKSRSVGEKIEWRGVRNRGGFEPYAALLRVIVSDDEDKRFNVLTVIRVEWLTTCVMAAVDEAANADATALARAAADKNADEFSCARDKPAVLGIATKWARQVAGLDGDPPR
jgi:hypothetical protein